MTVEATPMVATGAIKEVTVVDFGQPAGAVDTRPFSLPELTGTPDYAGLSIATSDAIRAWQLGQISGREASARIGLTAAAVGLEAIRPKEATTKSPSNRKRAAHTI